MDSNSTVSALVVKAALWVTINPMTENTYATNVRLATQHLALGKAPPKKYPARVSVAKRARQQHTAHSTFISHCSLAEHENTSLQTSFRCEIE